jgi:hypothetical protein
MAMIRHLREVDARRSILDWTAIILRRWTRVVEALIGPPGLQCLLSNAH